VLDLLLISFSKRWLLTFLLPSKTDRENPVFRCDLDDEVDLAISEDLALHFDKFEKTGAIKRADVAVDHRIVKIDALAHLNIGANNLFTYVSRADNRTETVPTL